ncbi:MAG: hypothetical protein EB127_02215 [Alphaproteobacteria bacterium]|nr:hypothetical protein [Alphaproteobacteria bacterium]
MAGLSYGTKINKELLTYHFNPTFFMDELPFVSDGAGDGTQATLIDCTCLGGVSRRAKSIRIQTAETNSMNIVFNVWFAASREELETAITTQNPAQLIAFGGNLDATLPVTTEWFAIDYDRNLTGGSLDLNYFYMSITVS